MKFQEINFSGVYCFENKINNKFYIGSSNCIARRYANHKKLSQEHTVHGNTIIEKAFRKYGFDNFEFKVLKKTDDYLNWESLFIRLLNPEYNAAGVNIEGKLQPNLGKKFDQYWINKMTKHMENFKHSEETLKKLTILNKEGGCKLTFIKDNEVLKFATWVEAGKHFNTKANSIAQNCKRNKSYKGYTVIVHNKQTKRVRLIENETLEFDSASKCDKYLNLWRGATSNAIRNNNGIFHNYKVEYI